MAGIGDFVERRKAAWDELSHLIQIAGSAGVGKLSREQLQALGPLYRRTASDLAYARLRGGDPTLIAYLNDLVGKAHGLLYAERGPGAGRLRDFLLAGFPRLLRYRRAYILLAAALLLLGSVVGAGVVAANPKNLKTVVPAQFADNDRYYAERAKNKKFDAPDDAKPLFAAGLMFNNIKVAVFAFAFGLLGGFPTLIMLFVNGLPLGALAMQQHQHGRDLLFWSLILPHGIVELTAIIIAGGAGMIIGHALIAPGELTRKDAVTVAGHDASRLILGTVLLFVIAGFTESFVTPSALPPLVKLGYAAMTAIGLAAYFRAGAETS